MRTTKLPERQGKKKTEWQSYVRLVHRHTKEKKKKREGVHSKSTLPII